MDSHTHLKHGDAAKAIVEVMDATDIDQFPARLIPYVYALPSYERPAIEELDFALQVKRFLGIKIYAGECRLQGYIIDPVFTLAAQHGTRCLVDTKGDARVARRLTTSFPETTFPFAHMGAYLSRDQRMVDTFIRLAGEFGNVLLDTSTVALLYKMEEAVKKAGAEKLVWGTDGPCRNPGLVSYAESELDNVRRLEISQADKEKLLGGNVAKLLGL